MARGSRKTKTTGTELGHEAQLWKMANPPFNDSDWRGELLKEDKRWVYAAQLASRSQLEEGCSE